MVLFLPRILISSNFFNTSADAAPASALYASNTSNTNDQYFHKILLTSSIPGTFIITSPILTSAKSFSVLGWVLRKALSRT